MHSVQSKSCTAVSRTNVGRTTVLAVVGAVAALSATAVAPAHAAPADPLVSTGDIGKVRMGDNDTLEDVLEHISVPFGGRGTLTHQMYDSRVADSG